MSGPAQRTAQAAPAADATAPDVAVEADDAGADDATGAASAVDTSVARAPSAAARPLTSLSSLLGGAVAGGQACDADGNCD